MDSVYVEESYSEGKRQRMLPRLPKDYVIRVFGRAQRRFIVGVDVGVWIS